MNVCAKGGGERKRLGVGVEGKGWGLWWWWMIAWSTPCRSRISWTFDGFFLMKLKFREISWNTSWTFMKYFMNFNELSWHFMKSWKKVSWLHGMIFARAVSRANPAAPTVMFVHKQSVGKRQQRWHTNKKLYMHCFFASFRPNCLNSIMSPYLILQAEKGCPVYLRNTNKLITERFNQAKAVCYNGRV
jgi:hypothetical protein